MHHPGGSCTLVEDEEIPPDNVERFECFEKAEKRYINVMNFEVILDDKALSDFMKSWMFSHTIFKHMT